MGQPWPGRRYWIEIMIFYILSKVRKVIYGLPWGIFFHLYTSFWPEILFVKLFSSKLCLVGQIRECPFFFFYFPRDFLKNETKRRENWNIYAIKVPVKFDYVDFSFYSEKNNRNTCNFHQILISSIRILDVVKFSKYSGVFWVIYIWKLLEYEILLSCFIDLIRTTMFI